MFNYNTFCIHKGSHTQNGNPHMKLCRAVDRQVFCLIVALCRFLPRRRTAGIPGIQGELPSFGIPSVGRSERKHQQRWT